MAWNTTQTPGAPVAGDVISFLDTYLTANQYWHCEDASAGTNAKAYHCYDPARNQDFIVLCNDNYATYCIFTIWQAWDSVNHAGVGGSTTSAIHYKANVQTIYGISVLDHRFILTKGSDVANYFGSLTRADTSKCCPMITGGSTGYSNTAVNGLGYLDQSTYPVCKFLRDEEGNANASGVRANGQYAYFRTYQGDFLVAETPVTAGIGNAIRIQGTLTGAMALGTASQGIAGGDTILVDGVEWGVFRGGYNTNICFVRKS